MCNVLAI